ncbi:MAG: hypothetical protein ACXWUX_06035 [Allosphingosinicella sp.]
MATQAGYWAGAGVALAMMVAAGIADWRRLRRRELDEAGWVPWRGIQVVGFFAVVGFTVLALHA